MNRPWTSKDDEYLVHNYDIETNRELAAALRCSRSTLEKKARTLALKKPRDFVARTMSAIAKQNYGNGRPNVQRHLNSRWKGWRITNGYHCTYMPEHPFVQKSTGYVHTHRLVVERFISRYLRRDEIVHHRNETILDNRLENLQVLSRGEHQRLHAELRKAV